MQVLRVSALGSATLDALGIWQGTFLFLSNHAFGLAATTSVVLTFHHAYFTTHTLILIKSRIRASRPGRCHNFRCTHFSPRILHYAYAFVLQQIFFLIRRVAGAVSLPAHPTMHCARLQTGQLTRVLLAGRPLLATCTGREQLLSRGRRVVMPSAPAAMLRALQPGPHLCTQNV